MLFASITIGSGGVGPIPDRLINRIVGYVQCPPPPGNTAAITINGLDSYSPGYAGPGGPLPLASVTGTAGDVVTIGVHP